MIDLIEHLEKKDGLELLKEADRVARKQIIVYTPLGFFPMHFDKKDGTKDIWGLDGGEMQEHRSGWKPEDFGKTWDFYICEDCHEAFLPEEKASGKKYSGLMAIKTKKFNGFKSGVGTPDFVEEVYRERVINNESDKY
jgi:diadenosine tetraphosphatase ApaH/serine/threonine PP2A family protein phosphatase